jgi:hemerythrin superfamily protein
MGADHDAVPLLVEQHRQIADLFRRTLDATGVERQRLFVRLRRLIAAHETAEEVLVHPRLRWVEQSGDLQAKTRTEEETDVKDQLVALEKLDVESAEFGEGLTRLQAVALAHNSAEETEEFPLLSASLDETQQKRLRRRIVIVEKLAPTRPHPGLVLGGENVLAGGMTAMVDRMRDLLSRKAG